jgi:hypothetical protein
LRHWDNGREHSGSGEVAVKKAISDQKSAIRNPEVATKPVEGRKSSLPRDFCFILEIVVSIE